MLSCSEQVSSNCRSSPGAHDKTPADWPLRLWWRRRLVSFRFAYYIVALKFMFISLLVVPLKAGLTIMSDPGVRIELIVMRDYPNICHQLRCVCNVNFCWLLSWKFIKIQCYDKEVKLAQKAVWRSIMYVKEIYSQSCLWKFSLFQNNCLSSKSYLDRHSNSNS